MGWRIHEIKNTVKINSKIALDLYGCGADVCSAWEDECDFPSLGGIIDDGKLVFNPDHMEHMDYVWEPKIQEVLKRHKVKGDICFSSNDGDNKGQRWGYRFDGEGGMVKLTGKRNSWQEDAPKKPTKKKTASKKATPEPDPLTEVQEVIDREGFDYAFREYSEFKQVKDKKFHQLRMAYIDAANELEKFIAPT